MPSKKITSPQIPRQLTILTDFADAIALDETISGASIQNQTIEGTRAASVSISDTTLLQVGLSQTKLERLSLLDCRLTKCELTAASFTEASWQRVAVIGNRASGLQLQNSTLRDINFEDCKLNLVNFRAAKLKNVCFKNCDLTEADFYSAELDSVYFENCLLSRAQFSGAKLKKTDFRTSDIIEIRGISSLSGAIIDTAQLLALAPALAAQYNISIEDN